MNRFKLVINPTLLKWNEVLVRFFNVTKSHQHHMTSKQNIKHVAFICLRILIYQMLYIWYTIGISIWSIKKRRANVLNHLFCIGNDEWCTPNISSSIKCRYIFKFRFWKESCGLGWVTFIIYQVAIGCDHKFNSHSLCPYSDESFRK